jgi:hypothetical protein
MSYMTSDTVEVCLETATLITPDAIVVPLRQQAPRSSRFFRPPLRYLDLAAVARAWHRASKPIRDSDAEVVYLNRVAIYKARRWCSNASLLRCIFVMRRGESRSSCWV